MTFLSIYLLIFLFSLILCDDTFFFRKQALCLIQQIGFHTLIQQPFIRKPNWIYFSCVFLFCIDHQHKFSLFEREQKMNDSNKKHNMELERGYFSDFKETMETKGKKQIYTFKYEQVTEQNTKHKRRRKRRKIDLRTV